jgi:3-hydroxyacyl-CoA dehydrogenase
MFLRHFKVLSIRSCISQHSSDEPLAGSFENDEAVSINTFLSSGRLVLEPELGSAVATADIVQEQGPENLEFKQSIWCKVEAHASPSCLFWSSTSGIPASAQSAQMTSQSRVVVVHPYNPPHVMPLIEIVPSSLTSPLVVSQTLEFWKRLGRSPIVLKKEITGFVANRLAFALLREAIHIVNEGVLDVTELDQVVESSLGLRWARAGPFKSYAAGGGPKGFEGFMEKIGGTVQDCWNDLGEVNVGEEWEKTVFEQTKAAYGDRR